MNLTSIERAPRPSGLVYVVLRRLLAILLVAAAACGTQRAEAPKQDPEPTRADPALAHPPPEPPSPVPTRESLWIYIDPLWAQLRFSALARGASGTWERCDYLEGLGDGEHHGGRVKAAVSRFVRNEHGHDRVVCTLADVVPDDDAPTDITIFSPPAFGPFSAGMTRAEVAAILGVEDVPEETAGAPLHHGPFELHMDNGQLRFVSALRSELGPIAMAGSPTLPPEQELELGGQAEKLHGGESFRPALSKQDGWRYGQLIRTLDPVMESLGGSVDLRPVGAPTHLLFVGNHMRDSWQRGNIRTALIQLHRAGKTQ